MSVSLDPIVANKLEQFARRRLCLIVARGLCAGLVTFLICLAIVASIDWYWLLSDQTRWGLSLAMYLPVLIVVWMTCLRRMLHLPAKEEIASQVEQSEPELRENLLSAVELATDDASALHDSPVFRSLLQGKVAGMMGRIQVPALLPVTLVAKWFLAALIVIVAASILLLSSDARFRQLAARALLPGANIARVSRVNVEILQPTPHSLMLAEDETVAIVVAVSGGSFNEVILETQTEKQGTVRQSMRSRSDLEFTSNIHVMEESVEYRILAGDAVTQRFTIESRPRPRVKSFVKTFEYPEYSLLPSQTVTEPHGDLLALSGTKAQLLLELDQQVSAAELRIDPADSDEMVVLPLTQKSDSKDGLKWTAMVSIDSAAIYKVHLVSKATGFDNIFSPKYEIRPQPDLIPRAGFVDQQETTLLLPPNDIVALKAMAEDDLPLVSLEQHISINGRDWLALPLNTKPTTGTEGRSVSADWQWDLLNHKLKTGDQVMTKLVATDRKGNLGESVPLRILVAAQDFDPERHTIMEKKIGLVNELVKFSALLQEHKVTALETVERLRKLDQSEEQATLDRNSLADLADKQRDEAAEVLTEVISVEKEMPSGPDAYELDLVGRVIARLQREHANLPGFVLKAMQFTDDPNRRNGDLDEIKRAFERTADDAKVTSEHFQNVAAHNFVTAIAFDMEAMLNQQKLVVNSQTQTWDRLLRHETIVINQLKGLERLIRDQRRKMPASLDGQINDLLNWYQSNRERLQESTESADKLEQLKNVSQDFMRQLKDRQRFDVADGGLSGRLVNAWRDLDNRAGVLNVPLDQTAKAIQQENQLTAQASSSQDSAESKKLQDQSGRFVAEVDLKQRRSIEQLRVRKELTQNRKDADAQYAADASLTHRATLSLLNQHRQVAPLESTIAANLLEIAPAYRVLEAGHELSIVRDTLDWLINRERWDSQTIQARIEHPRQWDLIQRGFELASQRLREAAVKNELVGALDQIRWNAAVRDAARKISERRWKRDDMVSAGNELVSIREDLEKVRKDLEPVMADARAIIARYSPSIPQMAAQTAEQIRQMEEATTSAADTAEKPEKDPASASEASQQLSELNEQQESINQQIADLTEALVEDANAQDMLDESQRERARDADDSIAMIQEPAIQMNHAMEKAMESESGEQQAQELAQAAEQQEKTAQALELVAEHFDQLDKGLNVADTRAELRQAERDLGIARQMDQQYEGSEQLAQMAGKETGQLISELEKELQQNPAMQKALSEISQNALQEARNALEYAANDDENIQRSNEQTDAEFQAKKRELAENLREMAAQAAQLSGALVAQANQAAGQGKTVEAQKKFAETQQKLNELASKANAAREELLLQDLAQTAVDAKSAITEATEILKQAKQQTQVGKDEKIHADDKARDKEKNESEKRRQQFHEQQKRTAADVAKRADDAKKRAEQAVGNSEKAAAAAEERVNQAQNRLNSKPDDQGLKNNLAQEQVRRVTEQQKVTAAKELLQRADQKSQTEAKRSEEIKSKPLPPLDAQNPATQLADQYAEEAIKVAEALNQKADQLLADSKFGTELSPPKNQLAQAEIQQKEVTQDVKAAAEDVARAARHERRLNNPTVAEPLQNAANSIQQVARNESANAEQQLKSAASEAEQAETNALANPQNAANQPNDQSVEAQQKLAVAEKAIAAQGDQLTGVLDPLLAAAEAARQQSGETSDSPEPGNAASQQASSGPQANSQPKPNDPTASTQPSDGQPSAAPATALQTPGGQEAGNPPSGDAAAAPISTPEQLARGEQLARTLDELDRLQAAAANAALQGNPVPSKAPSRLDSLAQAARTQQATQAEARIQSQQEAALALGEGGEQSSDTSPGESQIAEFGVAPVNRNEGTKWGKLRTQSAEDLTKGKSEAVSEEYRKSVETYFRVLAERAKKRK